MCLYTKIRKQDSRSKMLQNYMTIYATMQPALSELPPSTSMGVAVAGSESEVSKAMEESVAKRSIGV